MHRLATLLLIAAVLALTVAGSADGAAPARSPLDTALTLAPPRDGGQTYSFEFTNEGALQKAVGSDPRAAREAGFYAGTPSMLWKPADVQWESRIGTNGPDGVSATALRPGADLGPIARTLTGCHYATSTVGPVAVYSATESQVVDCSGDFGAAVPFFRHIAVDAARHIILASNSLPAVTAAIRGTNDLHRNAAVRAALAPLAGDQAIVVSTGADFCRSLTRLVGGPDDTPQTVLLARRADPAGAPYATFAFGTRFARRAATAQIVLGHANPASARADLALRERVLRNGFSPARHARYSTLFTLRKGAATGANVLLDVAPVRGGPLPLYDMWSRSDLGFARC